MIWWFIYIAVYNERGQDYGQWIRQLPTVETGASWVHVVLIEILIFGVWVYFHKRNRGLYIKKRRTDSNYLKTNWWKISIAVVLIDSSALVAWDIFLVFHYFHNHM